MPKMQSYRAESEPEYHNNTECVVGNSIERDKRLLGNGSKPLCRVCAALNRSENKVRD